MVAKRRKHVTAKPAADESAAEGTGARPIWSGTISFGLVAVPVNLFPAVRAADSALRMLAPDGAPVERHFVCPEHGKDVDWGELVRGFEVDDGRYVALTAEELESIAPRKSRDIDLRRFVPRAELDPFLFERAYVLAPTGESTKAYRLLAQVMADEGKAGIATFVMRTKEYLVAILAHDGILWAETLRFADEVRTPKDAALPKLAQPERDEVTGFARAIDELHAKAVDRDDLVDHRGDALRELAEKKQRAGDVVAAPQPTATAEPVPSDEAPDLFESIRESLRVVRGATVRAAGPRRARPGSTTGARRRSQPTGRRRGKRAPARS